MTDQQEVLFEEKIGKGGNLGVITLNRQQVLNSLNHHMISAMQIQLNEWANAASIKAVVIKAAEGRAFCAGGDLRTTYSRYLNRDPMLPFFFKEEYQLNRTIFHFPKPYIALLDGITMGGGVGISIHGSHRIATEHLTFAMPETGIGFFPDVGGSYFLPRLNNKIGFYLGLTGAKLNGDDCVALGLAHYKVAADVLPILIEHLAQYPFKQDANASVNEVIGKVSVPPSLFSLATHQSTIDSCFSKNSIEAIIQALNHSNKFAKEVASTLGKKSPASLKITLKALQNGRYLDFDICMQQEYRAACRFLEDHDFFEGIRAVIIDKDQMPQWQPSTLEEVTPAFVEKYFAPLFEELV